MQAWSPALTLPVETPVLARSLVVAKIPVVAKTLVAVRSLELAGVLETVCVLVDVRSLAVLRALVSPWVSVATQGADVLVPLAALGRRVSGLQAVKALAAMVGPLAVVR